MFLPLQKVFKNIFWSNTEYLKIQRPQKYFDKPIKMDSDINLGRFYFIFLYVVKRKLVLFNIRLINIGQSSNFPDQFIAMIFLWKI